MVLMGETIATGAPKQCEDCQVTLKLQVLSSNAGYYIGTHCDCGPYSRESDYYPKRSAAEKDLSSGIFERQ